MLVTLGWMLLAGFPLTRSTTIATTRARRPRLRRPGRVTVWTDRDEPYARGEGARVFLERGRALLRGRVPGGHRRPDPGACSRASRGPTPTSATSASSRSPAPGTAAPSWWTTIPASGYVFADRLRREPLDFRHITRGDYWDYRLIDGGRIQGDPVRGPDRPGRPAGARRRLRLRHLALLRGPALRLPPLRLLRLPRLRQLRRVGPVPRLVHAVPRGHPRRPALLPVSLRRAATSWRTGRPTPARASCSATPTRAGRR